MQSHSLISVSVEHITSQTSAAERQSPLRSSISSSHKADVICSFRHPPSGSSCKLINKTSEDFFQSPSRFLLRKTYIAVPHLATFNIRFADFAMIGSTIANQFTRIQMIIQKIIVTRRILYTDY